MSKPKDIVHAELAKIMRENDGLLRPDDVVEAARLKSHPLHDRFNWDNTSAAHQYRLWQARELIMRVRVEYPVNGKSVDCRVFVSLTPDRVDSGYRELTSVLSDTEMREQLLQDALGELGIFQEKYRTLKELSAVFSAIKKVRKSR